QNPIELLHISDIQSAALGRYEEGVFKAIQRIDPDLVIHTGDLLQPVPPATWESEFPKIQRLFESIAPRFGILNIYGNCEMHLTGFLEDHLAGVETLDGRNIRLDIGETKLRIHGLRFFESEVDASSVAKKLSDMSGEDELIILLGHSPNFILSVLDQPIDLCLAGHTHGGQIRIPGVGSLLTFSALPKKWASGFHEVGQARFNVSAGIGTEGTEWLPPIRLFCPPEMTLIHLSPVE
ncbi:MAG: metallophosphoesterase, partial [Candidatus Omnitrophica bacterium]|nr:metallophosphoesterase [Candidatus Omnitrophota bacterium]